MRKSSKKVLSVILVLALVLVLGIPVFADNEETDATTSATDANWKSSGGGESYSYENPEFKEGTMVYTVKSGDALWKIARQYQLTTDELLALNPQVKNASLIYVGQKLAVGSTMMPEVDKDVDMDMATLYQGLGEVANFRDRSGHYSFNITMASAIFDANGKIVNVIFDVYEIGPDEFPTWPTEEVSVSDLMDKVQTWETKRERGDDYGMAAKATTGNEWYVQLNNYQDFFKGMTVAEVRAWFDKSTGANGKPIVATTEDPDELIKYNALTKDEQMVLADVTSGATMSLSDSHSLFIEALEEAWANRVMAQ